MARAAKTLLAGLLLVAALTACTSGQPASRSISRAASPPPAPSAPAGSSSPGSASPGLPPSAVPPTTNPPPPTPASPPAGTGVNGVTVMDRCPVARADPPCPPKPVPAHVIVTDASTGAMVTTFDSGNDGQFSVALKPGRYVLRPDRVAGAPPRGQQSVTVSVNAGRYTTLTIRIESGLQ